MSIKKDLEKHEIIKVEAFRYDQEKVYSINHSIVPKELNLKNIKDISLYSNTEKEIVVYKTKNQIEQVLAVIEKAIKLLEQGNDINKLKIINSMDSDDYHLVRLFDCYRLLLL